MASSTDKAAASCPCGLPATTAACCGRYHAGEAAPTPEALMRSRYSAYVLGLADYLLTTWHPSTRPTSLDLTDSPRWLGLTVKRAAFGEGFRADEAVATGTPAPEARATVEFVARYKIGGRAHRLHEVSRFVLEGGRWYYVDGEIDQ